MGERPGAKLMLLDALYYQGTPAAVAFIARVARENSDAPARERARWILQHPMPVEAAWKP